jgi:hypothetical protein
MEFLWTVREENERRMLGSWCGVVGDVHASFYRPREGERGHE